MIPPYELLIDIRIGATSKYFFYFIYIYIYMLIFITYELLIDIRIGATSKYFFYFIYIYIYMLIFIIFRFTIKKTVFIYLGVYKQIVKEVKICLEVIDDNVSET